MPSFTTGDKIFVPASLLGIKDSSFSVLSRDVLSTTGRSVVVDSVNGASVEIASARTLERIGILLLCMGDFDSEAELLSPLYKSLLHFLRLLVGPEIKGYAIRSMRELEMIWNKEHGTKLYLIMVGHGRKNDDETVEMYSAVDGWFKSERFLTALESGATEVSVVCAGCQTGRQSFSKPLSLCSVVREVIAPHRDVPSAVASQFIQNYFTEKLVAGRTGKVAFKKARLRTAAGHNFRRWKNGSLDM